MVKTNRVGVLSSGKIFGLIYAALGLILGPDSKYTNKSSEIFAIN
jgi:hypothetical protein